MPKKNSDQLFQLIKSLNKAEKRYFKLFVSRVKSGEDAKFLKLFDMIDKQDDFDENKILQKEKSFKPSQLSNLKAHLYKQIMQSLRNYNSAGDIDIKIREMLDYTTILYNRCLYDQCMKSLEKAKQIAVSYEKSALLVEILEIEKKLVTKFIKSNIEGKVSELISESVSAHEKLYHINTFSNLSVKLYSFYIKIGFIRNQKDFEIVNSFLYSTLPAFKEELLSFDEKMYLYNSLASYYFFIQEYNRGYEYAKKWVALFDNNPTLIVPKIEMYIKGINNLLMAQSKLSKYDEFISTSEKFYTISKIPALTLTYNIRLQLFKYESMNKINRFFMLGEFDKGVKIIPEIAESLKKFSDKLDAHYIIIFYYKFACMYIGDDDYKNASFWLNKIINGKDVDLRSDIHSYARILNLICQYELENTDQIEYYIRSTYRFLIKKQDLYQFQRYIMKFLKRLGSITRYQLIEAFKDLKEQLLPLTQNPYEKRPFIYFDIISWLESKIEDRPIQEIIQGKTMKIINLGF